MCGFPRMTRPAFPRRIRKSFVLSNRFHSSLIKNRDATQLIQHIKTCPFRRAATPFAGTQRNWKTEGTMPHIRFTQNIQRHVSCPPAAVDGSTVRDALESYFARIPQARGYVLDDRQALRKHMAIFINGEPILDREHLSDSISNDATIDIIQALSGG